ncbi:MAG: hypothetical protein R6U96_10150, partial [Promethearchaeia archaeon]
MSINENNINNKELMKTLLKEVPIDFFIKQGIPAIITKDQILMRPVYGLGPFLNSWRTQHKKDPYFTKNILDFLKNIKDYVDYANRILEFIHKKDRIPEKDEAWELGIPIEQMDLILEIINIKVKKNVLQDLSLKERKYYDKLSKPLILSEGKLKELKLEDLTVEQGLNLIDAKILPRFINNILEVEDLSSLIAGYFDLKDISKEKKESLNELATKVLQENLLEEKNLSLLELARTLETTILQTGEVLYFLNNSENLIEDTFSDEEIASLSKILIKSLKYCRTEDKELSTNLLIRHFNQDLLTAQQIIELYGKSFSLPSSLSRKEIKHMDQISKSVITYMKEVKEELTIDDLMINLDLDIKEASLIFPFINRVTAEGFQLFESDFETYPEKIRLNIDDLGCKLLTMDKREREQQTVIDLAYKFNVGVLSIKRAIEYVSWIENKITKRYIQNLTEQERKTIEEKVKAALEYVKKEDFDLSFNVLIEEIGFNLKDAHLIIGVYNQLISQEITLDELPPNRKSQAEKIARKIYKAKKQRKITSYEPKEVFTLDIKGRRLQELWEALVYLKVKVLDILMKKESQITTDLGRIHSKGKVQLRERHGTKVDKKEDIKLTKETIKLEESAIDFKSSSDKVQLKRGTDFVGGLVRYKVAIKNNTDMIINNIEVTLQMTAEHIRIAYIKPRVYQKGERGKIPSMSPRQSESIDFYLEPLICGSIPVAPMVTYTDAFGNAQMSTREKLMLTSKCPPIINPGEENIAKVKNLFQGKETVRSFRSFKLDHGAERTFDLLREAIGAWAGRSVHEPIYENKEPFIAEVYYFVLNQNPDPHLGHREQIIVRIRVDEEKNVAMIYIGAEKNETVNGVLTHVWQLTNDRLGEAFGYRFKSLRCPECGGSLDNME